METLLRNMKISTDKTKPMIKIKRPVRCKLELSGSIIQHVMGRPSYGYATTGTESDTSDGLSETNDLAKQLPKCFPVASRPSIFIATLLSSLPDLPARLDAFEVNLGAYRDAAQTFYGIRSPAAAP
ncbi:hypothetical protein Trydic_g3560 [Trypoxylus dichotomus]